MTVLELRAHLMDFDDLSEVILAYDDGSEKGPDFREVNSLGRSRDEIIIWAKTPSDTEICL